jgi:hypothetical protein
MIQAIATAPIFADDAHICRLRPGLPAQMFGGGRLTFSDSREVPNSDAI